MKEPKNVRHLASKEIAIAKDVFRNTIPYNQILVTDGLGGGDRPFAVPTNIPMRVPFKFNFNVKGGKYAIHAGDGYYGMSRHKEDKKLLIHELAHVWQGENDTSWSWAYVIFSLKDQALSKDAYEYNPRRLKPWSFYGPEQQAKIVEDWYADGMQTFHPKMQTGDRRYYYIKKHIWGERVVGDWTFVPIRPIEEGTLNIKMTYPDLVALHLLPILERSLRKDDRAGIALRRRELEEFFQGFGSESSQELLLRLRAERPDDKLARSFKRRLATATRQWLLNILITKSVQG